MSHTAETGRGTSRQGLDADLRVPVDPQTIERPGPGPGLCCHLVADAGIAAGSDAPFPGMRLCVQLGFSVYLLTEWAEGRAW